MRLLRALQLLVLLPVLSACGRAAGPAPASPASGAAGPAPSPVVAQLGDERVTAAELDAELKGPLLQIRQQEYDLRRDKLKKMMEERLLQREARSRGLSVEQLLAQEVEAGLKPPSPQAVAAFYEDYKGRLGGRSLAEVRHEIESFLTERQRRQRRAEYLAGLSEKAGVKLLLEPPRFSLSLPASAPTSGPADAPVVVVEYADYQCPYCQRAEENVQALLKRYAGRIKLVHRDYPLESHPQARAASEAAHCAGEQGRFFEYRHGLMVEPGDMQASDLRRRAEALRLDLPAFGTCLSTGRYREQVESSLKEGQELGVSSTPTFFVNGRMLLGARPLEDFVEVVEDELKRAGKP